MGNRIRNSRVEVLRITSMLLIVAFHGMRQIPLEGRRTFSLLTGTLLSSWGILGVEIFLFVGAWFLVDQHFRIQKVVQLVFQTGCYILGFSLLSIVYNAYQLGSLGEAVRLIPAHFLAGLAAPLWSDAYWFVTAYLIMLLLSGRMNRLVSRLSRRHMILLSIIPICGQLIYYDIYTVRSLITEGSALCDAACFCYVYLLAGYLKRHSSCRIRGWWILAVTGCIACGLSLRALPDCPHWAAVLLDLTIACKGRHSVVMLLDGVLISLWVLQQPPRGNRLVNRIASLTFGVYLFHECHIAGMPKLVDLLVSHFPGLDRDTPVWCFPLACLAATAGVFLLGTLAELVRSRLLQQPFMNWFCTRFASRMAAADAWFEGK